MLTAPDAAIPMVFIIFIACFKMIAVVQWFRNKIPLQGGAIAVVNGESFVGAPAHGAMIDDDVSAVRSAKCVIAAIAIDHAALLIFIAHAKTQVANDDIITGQVYRVIGQTNTIAGRSLP